MMVQPRGWKKKKKEVILYNRELLPALIAGITGITVGMSSV